GQRVVDPGGPFKSVYLLPLANRSPESMDDTLSHLGSYLFHELTTPLGIRLEQARQQLDAGGSPLLGALTTPYRSFGTYAIWFPRGLLLRAAVRMACRRLIDGWVATSEGDLSAELQTQVATMCTEVLSDPDLQPPALEKQLEQHAAVPNLTEMDSTPGEAVAR